MEIADLYGFGSFFSDQNSSPRDVDLLIVHQRIDNSSINFAIHCKAAIKGLIPCADTVLLSTFEEQELAFLQKCSGKFLGRLTDADPSAQLKAIFRFAFASSTGGSVRGKFQFAKRTASVMRDVHVHIDRA
ncbi:hypothetical protein [Nitrobacter sp.]|uniref:hypothetical protein n=1 Tax=Nitrobacter sp. TaxID=29420 RepID=UPI003F64F503